MKGKVGFVLGAVVGYVLGTRAGRARYEQIKRGAISVWETPLVQQGVNAVKDSVSDRVDGVKDAAGRAAKNLFTAAVQPRKAESSSGSDARATSDATPGATKAAGE